MSTSNRQPVERGLVISGVTPFTFRRALDYLYRLSGGLAAFFLLSIGVSIVFQFVGRWFGLVVDSTEASGFCMAASSFLGLAYTLRCGGHIRVNLLLTRLAPGLRHWLELWCCGVAAAILAFLSWHAVVQVLQSYEFGDRSPGLIGMYFWIPQSGMALGLIIMAVAFIDEIFSIIRGNELSYETNADNALE